MPPPSSNQVNQNDISYIKSLMLFVKDLGPTAQMMAKQKLKGTQGKSGQIQESALNAWETGIMTNSSSDKKVADLILNENHTVIDPRNDLVKDKWPDADHDGKEKYYNRFGVPQSTICCPNINDRSYDKDNLIGSEKASKRRKKKNHGTNKSGTLDLESERFPSTFGMINNSSTSKTRHLVDSVRNIQKHASMSTATSSIRVPPLQDAESFHSISKAKEKTVTTVGTSTSPWSIGLSNYSSRLSSNYQGTKRPADRSHDPSNKRGGVVMNNNSSNQAISSSHAKQCPPWATGSPSNRFTFDIPFLKSQLNQMKVMGQEKERLEVQRGLFPKPGFLSAEAPQEPGNLCDPKIGYIKVPVHFADQPSSLPAAKSTVHIQKHPQSVKPSLSTSASTFPAGVAADDTKLTLKL